MASNLSHAQFECKANVKFAKKDVPEYLLVFKMGRLFKTEAKYKAQYYKMSPILISVDPQFSFLSDTMGVNH